MNTAHSLTLPHRIALTRTLQSIALLIALLAGATACQKDSINGHLDGQWQIMTITDTADGTETHPESRFFCFFLHTCNVTYGGIYATANMTYDGSALTLDFPYNKSDSRLAEWGLNTSGSTTLRIITLTGSRLVMENGPIVIELRKY